MYIGYLINQFIDIFAWGWIALIMIRLVVCKALEVDTEDDSWPPHRRFRKLIRNHHYLFNVGLLIYSVIALSQYANQYYFFTICHNTSHPMVARQFIWMLGSKVLEASILTKYWRHQPQFFLAVKDEFKVIFNIK